MLVIYELGLWSFNFICFSDRYVGELGFVEIIKFLLFNCCVKSCIYGNDLLFVCFFLGDMSNILLFWYESECKLYFLFCLLIFWLLFVNILYFIGFCLIRLKLVSWNSLLRLWLIFFFILGGCFVILYIVVSFVCVRFNFKVFKDFLLSFMFYRLWFIF